MHSYSVYKYVQNTFVKQHTLLKIRDLFNMNEVQLDTDCAPLFFTSFHQCLHDFAVRQKLLTQLP